MTSADAEAVRATVESLRAELASLALAERLDALCSEVARLRAELAASQAAVIVAGASAMPAGQPAAALPEQRVTLDQIAAMVHRSKRSLDRYRSRMPQPCVRGRRGSSHLWLWSAVRPWLEETFSVKLPERFPGLAH